MRSLNGKAVARGGGKSLYEEIFNDVIGYTRERSETSRQIHTHTHTHLYKCMV